ncbi:hypothetical protein [Streptomyces sp. NPDC057257]|uniref:hypothetical protein n=1 Tax=Streptomyces sp. NPDC057257 TaxID=3346071 RepID=UPI003645BAA5
MVAVLAGLVVGGLIGNAAGGDSGKTPSTATSTVTATVTGAAQTAGPGGAKTAGRVRGGGFPGDGTFVVGKDIKPGTYRTDGPQGGLITDCYWARLSSTSGDVNDIIANESTKGQTTVTISPSDKAFTTNGCKTWEKVG